MVEPKRGARNLQDRGDGEDGFVEAGAELIPGHVRQQQAPRFADRRGVLPQLRGGTRGGGSESRAHSSLPLSGQGGVRDKKAFAGEGGLLTVSTFHMGR
jgi:hypothetical protein